MGRCPYFEFAGFKPRPQYAAQVTEKKAVKKQACKFSTRFQSRAQATFQSPKLLDVLSQVRITSRGWRLSTACRVACRWPVSLRLCGFTLALMSKPFKPKCTDLTAEYEGMNLGYVGGVRIPRP